MEMIKEDEHPFGKDEYKINDKGKPHGLRKIWYPYPNKKQLRFELTYVNGKYEGVNKCWSNNGKMDSISQFKKDAPHGIEIIFNYK